MRRLTVAVFGVMAILLLVGGCGNRETSDKNSPAAGMPDKIIVQAPLAPPTAPLFKMVADSLPEGTKLELLVYNTVDEATARVLKGEADFSVLPVNVAAKLYNTGIDISLANVNTWGILYLVSVDDTVKEWQDLKGMELYVGTRGTTPDVLTQYLLRRNGLKEGEVKLTYLGSPEIAQMVINGLVKNAVLPEPLVTQVLMKNQRARVVRDFYADWQRFEGETSRLPQTGMVVRNGFARSYPDAVAGFHRAYASALDWTVANPDQAAPLVESNLKMPAPVFVRSMERTRLQYAGGSGASKDVNAYLAKLLDFSPDMVGGKLPDEKFYLPQ
ncbi:MAG: NMT1/THI5 like protein [Pelotomaculum sp. PtaB.Bin104]|nr:MAG: NMT1/THI5 like protein [Pelotomaculum sp. PtaB.Bin104]